jgi:outer membrane protein TolC
MARVIVSGAGPGGVACAVGSSCDTRGFCAFVICVGAWLTLSPASAESLGEAWQRAVGADQGLAAVRAEAEAASLEAEAARAQRWPTLGLSAGYTMLDDAPAFDFGFAGLPIRPPEVFGGDDYATGNASVSLPLYTGGRISSSIAAAEARRRGAGLQAGGAEQDLRLAVAESYVAVLRAQRALAVADSSVASLASHARDLDVMYEREAIPKNDWLLGQVALADAQQNRLRAANALEVARASYNRRLGEPLDRVVELDDALPDVAGLPTTLEALVAEAQLRRPELAALAEQVETYVQLARAERARTWPQLAATGGYQYLENEFLDDDSFAYAGVGVQWSPFDGGQARKRGAALERSSRAAEARRKEVVSLVALQVRDAWLSVGTATQRIEVTHEAAAQAEEALRIARERHAAGLDTNTEVLVAESQRVQASRNRDDALLDAGLARLRLARAAGLL